MGSVDYTTQGAKLPLKVIWQDSPTSWTGKNEQDFQPIVQQLLALMGNDQSESWILVLDLDGPFIRETAGAWTQDMVVEFAKALKSVGLNPSLGYHPDAVDKNSYWAQGINPSDQSAQQAMVKDMAAINAKLMAADPSLPKFDIFIAEGKHIQRDKETFQYVRDQLNANDLKNAQLWSAASYTNGVTVDGTYSPERTVPDDGIYSQIYDFYNKTGIPAQDLNPFVGALTDPNDPDTGKKIFEAIQIPANKQLGANQLIYPERAYQIFNFSGANDASGKLTDAPVFGGMIKNKSGKLVPQAGVKAPGWDRTSFGTMLESYSEAFQQASGKVPTMGIWAAENGLNYLAPLSTINQQINHVFSSASSNNKEERVNINKYQHNAILQAKSETVNVQLNFNCSNRNSIGLYPLLDATGRIASLDGTIVHPLDKSYLNEALKLAKHNQLYKTDQPSPNTSTRRLDWNASVNAGSNYALIGESLSDEGSELHSSISAANNDKKVRFAGEFGKTNESIGFEDDVNNGDNDFNDITLRLASNSESTFKTESVLDQSLLANSNKSPDIDSIWMNGLALDSGTAYQLAELITGNPNNQDLDLVIDVRPPNDNESDVTSKSHKAKYPKYPFIKNTFDQYLTFLDNIDKYVKKLGGSTWDGRLIYHPQTEVAEFNQQGKGGKPKGWAGFTDDVPGAPGTTFTLTSNIAESYKAYTDWMGAFNLYMKENNQKQFSEFMFEREGSYWDNNTKLRDLFAKSTAKNSTARKYSGNPNLFSSGIPPLSEGQTTFSVSAGPTTNWDGDNNRMGFGADGNWAQIYDLTNAGYVPTWPEQPNVQDLDPIIYNAQQAVQKFNDFFYYKNGSNPKERINNLNRLVLPQADGKTPATQFDPRAHLIFTYSMDAHNDPGFANQRLDGTYWYWTKADFVEFIDGLRDLLPRSLNQAAGPTGQFITTKDDLNFGVWDSNRAMDSWFGIPDPSQLANF